MKLLEQPVKIGLALCILNALPLLSFSSFSLRPSRSWMSVIVNFTVFLIIEGSEMKSLQILVAQTLERMGGSPKDTI